MLVDYLAVDRFWNTKPQLSVVRETILSLSLPQFVSTRRDWSTTVDDIHDYVCSLICRRRDPNVACNAQLSSRSVSCLLAVIKQDFSAVQQDKPCRDTLPDNYCNFPRTQTLISFNTIH